MFSNLFICDAPDLDMALGLSKGKFKGIRYPSYIQMSDYLLKAIQADNQSEVLARLVPDRFATPIVHRRYVLCKAQSAQPILMHFLFSAQTSIFCTLEMESSPQVHLVYLQTQHHAH